MLIHPWDAALDRSRVAGLAGIDRPVRDARGQQPRPGPGAADAAHPLHRRRRRAAHPPGPAEPRLAAPGGSRARYGWPWSATTPTSRRTGGPRPADPTRTACRPATTPPCSSCADPSWSTTRRTRPTSSPPSSPTSNPRAATPPWPSTQAPYGRMLSGIRGVRLPVLRVDAKFKYDDANPVDHRERVIDHLEQRRPRARRRGGRPATTAPGHDRRLEDPSGPS